MAWLQAIMNQNSPSASGGGIVSSATDYLKSDKGREAISNQIMQNGQQASASSAAQGQAAQGQGMQFGMGGGQPAPMASAPITMQGSYDPNEFMNRLRQFGR